MKSKKIVLISIIILLFIGILFWLFFSSKQTIKQNVQSISAGGVEGYPMYTISVSNDWLVDHDGDDGIDRLTISNNGYAIRIGQEPGGGIQCLYNESGPEVEYPLSNYTSFTEITTNEGATLRRGIGFKNNFEFCENFGGEWSSPTDVGYIQYIVPENPDGTILKEMDAIISSLNTQSQ
ncbi:MAG: hypothetical protein HYT11_04120 [Candidatus Levybacteria bacterium]|nr:hypothetical protein [Candidatus Levybacteria bacterium]